MPRMVLTDIVLKTVKPLPKQMQYWDALFPTFGIRVNPRGTKTFNVMLGKDRRLIKIGRYPDICLAAARKRAHEIIDDHDPKALTFSAARDLFFAQHLDTLKATTAHGQKAIMRRFPFSKRIGALTLNDVNRVLHDLPRGSARCSFNVIRTFFNWCVANDYLESSPLKKSPYKPHHRDRLLTDDELRAIWRETHKHTTFGAIARVLILTGQRLNQVSSLETAWLRSDTIVFPSCIMKSNSQHTIPLTETVRAQLPPSSPKSTRRFVFPMQRGDKPFNNFSNSMAAFRTALPDVAHFTLHDFRRYFSSTMARVGTPIDITEAILDHRSGSRSQIQRVYDRYDRLPHMRSALKRYENFVFSIVEQA